MIFVPGAGFDSLCSKIPTMSSFCGPEIVSVVGAIGKGTRGYASKSKEEYFADNRCWEGGGDYFRDLIPLVDGVFDHFDHAQKVRSNLGQSESRA
jgi:hypothetical protein